MPRPDLRHLVSCTRRTERRRRAAKLKLPVVSKFEQVEALGDSEQAARLRRRVSAVVMSGAVDDPREQLHRRVVDRVLLDSAPPKSRVIVCVYSAPCVVGVSALAFGHLKYLIRRDVEKLGVAVDEVADQPGTGDPISLRALR